MIINFKEILGSDYSMENLVKRHTKEKTEGCLRFLNEICPIEGPKWEKNDVEVDDSGIKNLYYKKEEKHPLEDFMKAKNDNSKVCRIVWPTNPKNVSPSQFILV